MLRLSGIELARRFDLTLGRPTGGSSEPIVPPPDNVFFQVDQVTFNTASNTTQDFNANFDAAPAASLFSQAHTTVDGSSVADGGTTVGFAVGSKGGTVGGKSKNAVSTTENQRYKGDEDWVVARTDSTVIQGSADPSIVASPDRTRLTWITSADPLSEDFIGGVCQMSGSAVSATRKDPLIINAIGATSAQTGAGFAPDVLITLSGIRDSGSAVLVPEYHAGMGFAVRGGNQGSIVSRSADGVATSSVQAYMSDAWVTSQLDASVASGQEVTSWDADGTTVTARGDTGGSHVDLWLWLKLASNSDAAVEVLDFTDTIGVHTFEFGFRPRLVILAYNHHSTLNVRANVNAGLTVSFITAQTQTCSASVDAHGQATSIAYGMHTSKAFKTPNFAGNTLYEADFMRFTSTGMELNFTSVNPDARKCLALALR